MNMNDAKFRTMEQILKFMAGTEEVEFRPKPANDDRYLHISDLFAVCAILPGAGPTKP